MAKQFNYAETSQDLDEVVASLQSPSISVDEALIQYEKGMKLLEELETYLKDAEHKLTKLKVD
jgi:exodeoxyribonuclease VII small subunit